MINEKEGTISQSVHPLYHRDLAGAQIVKLYLQGSRYMYNETDSDQFLLDLCYIETHACA